jgi:hypothetical protein
MFYRGTAIHHLFVSDPTRVGDVMRIRVMEWLPGKSYVETSFPIGRNGGGRAIMGTANFAKNHRITVRWETLMGF